MTSILRQAPPLKWRDMKTAPHDPDTYIVVKHGWLPMVVRWDGEGWWLPEGSFVRDDQLEGWSPIPK